MGLTSLHGQLTVSVMTELGFNRAAAMVAAEANEAVDADENQGNAAHLANLHAMRGFLAGEGRALSMRGPRMQTEQEARQAVQALLQSAREEILRALQARRHREALEKLGAALHTVQDAEYHHYEPWPFRGLGDAILHASQGAAYGLPPHYMLCHAQRDAGYVNGLLNLSLTAFDYSAGYESGSGWSSMGRLEVTQVSNNPWLPHLSIGMAGRTNGPFGNEGLAYGVLTWGRIPSRPQAGPVPPNRAAGPLSIQRGPTLCPEGSEGGNSLSAARRATVDFINTLARLAPPNDWQGLRSFSP